MVPSILSQMLLKPAKKSLFISQTILLLAFVLEIQVAVAQVDSVKVLELIEIEAYRSNKPAHLTPSAIHFLTDSALQRFNPNNILSVVNVIPGVRMEERSPGSYRFSVRGSVLRSPFGVRNVKFYWNGLPFTDAGGNTYLNLLDPGFIRGLEISKGPASSMYGAGTGGVVFLNTQNRALVEGQISAGAFNTRQIRVGGGKSGWNVGLGHTSSDGYRSNSTMSRNSIQASFQESISSKLVIHGAFLGAELNYQTPGGLTLQELRENPRQARPAAGPNPGAIEQQTSVQNQTFFGGLGMDYQLNSTQAVTLSVSTGQTAFTNPALRNYETRKEQNYAIRALYEYQPETSSIGFKKGIAGFETQFSRNFILVRNNLQGNPGKLVINDDNFRINQGFGFFQADFEFGKFFVTTGLSVNFNQYQLKGLNSVEYQSSTTPIVSPRVAINYAFSDYFGLYSAFTRGFSMPTLAELRPSSGTFNPELVPEKGNNLEVGVKYSKARIRTEFALFRFGLNEAIVLRRDEFGAEEFVNAGNTIQTGMEISADWMVLKLAHSTLKWWFSGAFYDFRFKKYSSDGNDFSGNQLTGVPATTTSIGLTSTYKNCYVDAFVQYQSAIPLNDSNNNFSESVAITNLRVGYKKAFRRLELDFFAGADNLTQETYSSGFELNAVGGRFYNPAPNGTYFLGLKVLGFN